jgi:hypothetical protein
MTAGKAEASSKLSLPPGKPFQFSLCPLDFSFAVAHAQGDAVAF